MTGPGESSPRDGAAAPSPMADVTFLTVAEVASALRVSKMTVYRLVHSGELPAARVGRSFRVPQQAVQEYLRSSFFEAG
ncbi:MAG: helix-turn-helix domain-containing protein [Candidatus Nanopelagicales bacterium]